MRWLRPEYQKPGAVAAPQQLEAELAERAETNVELTVPAGKAAWPKTMREQIAAVRAALARQGLPVDAIAAQFRRSPKAAVRAVVEALEELGMVRRDGERFTLQA